MFREEGQAGWYAHGRPWSAESLAIPEVLGSAGIVTVADSSLSSWCTPSSGRRYMGPRWLPGSRLQCGGGAGGDARRVDAALVRLRLSYGQRHGWKPPWACQDGTGGEHLRSVRGAVFGSSVRPSWMIRTGGTLLPPGGRWKLNQVGPAAILRAGSGRSRPRPTRPQITARASWERKVAAASARNRLRLAPAGPPAPAGATVPATQAQAHPTRPRAKASAVPPLKAHLAAMMGSSRRPSA